MHTILLVAKSLEQTEAELKTSLDRCNSSEFFDSERVDLLLDLYSTMNRLNETTASRFTTKDKTLLVLRPQFDAIEKAIRSRRRILSVGDPVDIMDSEKKYSAIFKKSRREIQTYKYQIPDFFLQSPSVNIKRMIHFKLSNSAEYLSSGVQKFKFHLAWNNQAEEYQLLNKIPGLSLLNATPYESYCISLSKILERGYLVVEIDSNNFFSLEKHTPSWHSNTLTVKKEVYYVSRRIDPRTEFLSKDKRFVKNVLRQAYERMEKMFQVHTILYGKIA